MHAPAVTPGRQGAGAALAAENHRAFVRLGKFSAGSNSEEARRCLCFLDDIRNKESSTCRKCLPLACWARAKCSGGIHTLSNKPIPKGHRSQVDTCGY